MHKNKKQKEQLRKKIYKYRKYEDRRYTSCSNTRSSPCIVGSGNVLKCSYCVTRKCGITRELQKCNDSVLENLN